MQHKIQNKEDLKFPLYKKYGDSVFEMLSTGEWVEVVHEPSFKKYGIKRNTGDLGVSVIIWGEDINSSDFLGAYLDNAGIIDSIEMIRLTEKSTELEKREHVLSDNLDKEYHVDDIKGVL